MLGDFCFRLTVLKILLTVWVLRDVCLFLLVMKCFFRITFLLALIGTMTKSFGQCNYSPVGPDDHDQPSYYPVEHSDITVDKNGTPYIVYSDVDNMNKCTVRKYNGTSWEVVGGVGFSTGAADYTRITVDTSGTPFVVYADAGNSGRAVVQMYDGTAWVIVGSSNFSAAGVANTDIDIDSNGQPYIVYISGARPTVHHFNGTSWTIVGNAAFSPGIASLTSIAVDGNNVPYVLFNDGSIGPTTGVVMKFNGTSWVNVASSGGFICQGESDLDVDPSGVPYVVSCGISQLTYVRKYIGSWVDIGSGLSSSIASDHRIVVSSTGEVYICFTDVAGCKVKRYNGSWSNLLNIKGTAQSIALDPYSKPVIACKNMKCRVLKYNGTSWNKLYKEGLADADTDEAKLVVDSSASPYVLYYDNAAGRSFLKKQNGSSWISLATSYPFPTAEAVMDLGISKSDTLFIVFRGSGSNYKLSVLKFNGSSWSYVGTQQFGGDYPDEAQIDFDNNGKPFVAYSSYSRIRVMKFNGSIWADVGALGFTAPQSYFGLDMTISSIGTPFIAYTDQSNFDRASVMKFDGATWINVGLPGFTPAKADFINIATDQNNIPYVVFEDYANGRNCSVMKYNGYSWVYVGLPGFSAKGQVGKVSIKCNDIGTPYVFFSDSTNGGKASIMKFDGSSWINVGSSDFSAGRATRPNLAITKAGKLFAGFANEGAWLYTFDENDIHVNNSLICAGSSLVLQSLGTYTSATWSGPNGFVSSTPSNTITNFQFINNGIYTFNGAGGPCSSTQTINISAVPNPTVTVSSPVVACDGISSNLIANGASTYSWSNGATSNTITETPNTTTNYTVTGTDANNCVNTATTQITVNPNPVINVNNGTICDGQSFTITPSGANSYTYSGGSDVVNPNVSTTYTVIGEDLNNCTGTATTQITVNSNPTVMVASNSVCVGTSASLTASGAASYTWNTGATTNSITETPTVTTTYSVTGTDLNNCSNTQTVSITVDNSCQDVWPGDANSDGAVDNLDVLELGLHYTQTGTPRASVSNAWQSYHADNWTGTISNGKNVNHSNCNGDGIINDDDTLAIYNNYGLTHLFRASETNTVNPQLTIVPDQSMVAKGNWGTSSIYLGDASNAMSNLNGVAFTAIFDNTLIETDSVFVEYQNSFIGLSAQNLKFRKPDFTNGKLYTAITHTLSSNVNGYGKIATLHYKIKSNLAIDALLSLSLTQANQSDANGVITPLSSGSATLMAIGASVGLNEISNNNLIAIQPNPANGFVVISSTTEIEKIEVLNLAGQVLVSEKADSKTHQLDLENLANGVYFVKVYNSQKQMSLKKLVVQR